MRDEQIEIVSAQSAACMTCLASSLLLLELLHWFLSLHNFYSFPEKETRRLFMPRSSGQWESCFDILQQMPKLGGLPVI